MRIAGAAGFWGDRDDVLLAQVERGPVDVVIADYLAEVTMAILRRKVARDPSKGYAEDFLGSLAPALRAIVERKISVVTNAGGLNPRACAEAVASLARERGVRLRIGLVTGDDVLPKLDALMAEGVTMQHADTGAEFATVRDRVTSANAYFGARPIARAIEDGAQIVITGRCTDSALALGPLIAEYGWAANDFERLAAGVIAGHVIECGGQASGGNFTGGWASVPNLADLGYPIADVQSDGSFVVTKHSGTGGKINCAVVKEQLIYEIGDPAAYITPDVVADFTALSLEDLGEDRVRITGARGREPPSSLKASITYSDGWVTTASLTFVWPNAVDRARATEALVLARCKRAGLELLRHRADLVGVNAAHGPMAAHVPTEPPEVLLRLAVHTRDRETGERFAREIAPLFTSGIPGACRGLTPGRSTPSPIFNHWPALIPASAAPPSVEVIES